MKKIADLVSSILPASIAQVRNLGLVSGRSEIFLDIIAQI